MPQSLKKVLFISYDGMTDPLGQSQVIPYLLGLSRQGYLIFLLSCEKELPFNKNKALIEQLLKGYSIQWNPIKYTKNPPVFSTWLDIIKLKRKAKEIHKKNQIDIVHTRPGIPALVGLWMKKKWSIKFLHDIREFYADSRVEGGMWNIKNPLFNFIYHFFKRKEKEEIQHCDGIVCLTYAAEKIIRQLPEFNINIPLEVIPCSVDLNLFDPARIGLNQKKTLKEKLNISEDDFVISYLGSIGGWYLTDEMIQFCKVLSDKIPTTKFLFISPHRHEEIVAAARKFDLPVNKIIHHKTNREEVPLLLSLSNFSIFFIKPCYSKQSSSPTKHGEIMAMGIPLVTNSGVGDVEEIVVKYNSGIVLRELREEVYVKAVKEIISEVPFDVKRIRQGAKDFYSLESANQKYNRIYSKIVQQ